MLSYSRTWGSPRVLLATLAAVADQSGAVAELSTDEIQAAAGMADSTYRRARATLLGSGELLLTAAGGGRARANHWSIPQPRSINPETVAASRARPAPGPGARPLLATARPPESAPEDQLDLLVIPNETTEVAAAGERKGPGLSGVSAVNPGQNRTVSGETPPQTPPQTPPPNVRAGREPQNPRIRKDPPSPPEGGSDQLVSIIEDYLTPRGRQRHRIVTVDLDEIRSQLPSPNRTDHADWQQIRAGLESVVGASMFEIWLAPLDLVGCDDGGVLLLACPTATRQWVAGRYAAVIERIGRSHGRSARLATDRELQLLNALAAVGAETPSDVPLPHDHQEAV